MLRREGDFAWENYTPAHRQLVAFRLKQTQWLTRCSLCGRRPLAQRRVLVHDVLTQLGAEDLDGRPYVKALALCRQHATLTNDELADQVWPGWRIQAGASPGGGDALG
jgi:hypothetical protein